MTLRRAAVTAKEAFQVRRVQELAGLMALQAEMRFAALAEQRLEHSREVFRETQDGWSQALTAATFDVDTNQRWGAATERALQSARSDEEGLARQEGVVEDKRRHWNHGVRRTTAAASIARSTARSLQRARDEHQLTAAEDAAHAWRRPQ